VGIKILLVDDHKIMREGLRSLLENQPGMQVIAEAVNGREAVRLARDKRPDVVIMDIDMPDLGGIEATRQMCAALPEVKVIGLSIHTEKHYVVNMLRAGASGFLSKDCPFDELVQAIKTVVANHTYLPPGIADIMIEDYIKEVPLLESSAFSVLTSREREVLQLIAEGWSTKEMASHLNVSAKTVDTHRRQIMDKLNLHSIADLTKYAVQEGLTSARPK
jgi:DNA-binding NarL/FixJ family response regulator